MNRRQTSPDEFHPMTEICNFGINSACQISFAQLVRFPSYCAHGQTINSRNGVFELRAGPEWPSGIKSGIRGSKVPGSKFYSTEDPSSFGPVIR
ncbi:hypothetical protein AVEN_259776-1 [Araneus ventricosus]|uniref:Uncharacterized protein n=1 Tax=Araneus ventricosus TaxID=182803 RepID=A0A4Y2MNC0_ARAVE|nr:hypothetical protein AVEN_259776-1 [Araneus ventricosus]